MYLVCHKCAAAYLVEDNLIVRGDERAQCPNCLHVQPVVTPAAEPSPPPTLFRRPATPATAKTASPEIRIPSIPPVVHAPPSAPGDAARAFPGVNGGMARAGDAGSPAELHRPMHSGFNGPGGSELDGPTRPGIQRVISTGEALVEGATEARTDIEGSAAPACQSCGALLSDAFDRALGTCERCRAGEGAARVDEQGGANTASQAEALEDGRQSGSPQKWSDPSTARTRAPRSRWNIAVDPGAPWRAGRLLAGAVAVAALAFAVVGLAVHRRAPKATSQAKVSLSARLEKTREQWRAQVGEPRGEAAHYLKRAEEELAKDTLPGYAEAEKDFRAAFVRDADGRRSVPGYLQAIAWGRGQYLDASQIDELVSLAEAAELEWGRSAPVLLAYASLVLLRADASKDAERARSFAQEALGLATGGEKAVAHLVLSSAYLGSAAELAIQNADLALRLNPSLRRAYLHRAIARASLGDYRAAIEDLRARLPLDSDELSQAKDYLARLYQQVGECALALDIYPASDERDLQAIVSRAVIEYQCAGKTQAAAQELSEGIRRLGDSARPSVLSDAWVHLAASQRLSGRASEAASAANQALALSSADPGAHLQLFLLALEGGKAGEASAHFKPLQGHLGDPALEKVFEGRLSMAAHRELQAMRTFEQAAQLDDRRTDALLLAGAAAASAGRRDEALRYLVPAGQADPSRLAPSPLGTRLYFRPQENLFGADGRVIRMSKGSTDVTPVLYEALIRFHQRDLRMADKLLSQVLDVDTGNALAHALRALGALDRRLAALARSEAERAAAQGRGLGIAHYARGRVLGQIARTAEAGTELRQAESLAPRLLAAQVELARVEAMSQANAAAARARLLHVLRVDPSYLAAKRALYALER